MTARHRIAIVMLIVLAGLPLGGTICAMTCLSASAAVAAHHGAGQDCEKSASASSNADTSDASDAADASDASADARIVALSEHDCGNHTGALPRMITTPAQRADLAVVFAPAASDPVYPLFGSVTASASLIDYTPPQGTAPRTTPLVLRI